MKVEVVSKVGKSGCFDEQLYTFLSDFNNIKRMLPPEHADQMECTTDSCTVTVKNSPSLTLNIIERAPSKLIKIGTEQGGKDFFIWIQLKQAAAYDCRIRITLRTEMNLLMKTMAKKKLQQFVDGFVDGLCQIPPQALQHIQHASHTN